MNDYLPEIEAEYSRFRGVPSMLSPLDWQLAQSWEDEGIPLRIVLRAMGDVKSSFDKQKRPDKINSLSYFTQEVQKQYTDFAKTQIGKTLSEENNNDMTDNLAFTDDNVAFIENNLLTIYDCKYFAENTQIKLSDLMCAAVSKVRSELLILIDDINQKDIQIDEIESKLSAIASEFEISLVVDFDDSERQKMIDEAKKEFPKYKVTDQLMQKILIRKCYQQFGFPELTLFAL